MEDTDNDNRNKLVILQLNDVHAYLELHQEWFWENGRTVYRPAGGYARIASLINQKRKQYPNQVLAFDGGDTFHGTYPAVQSQGEVMIEVLNQVGFDAMTAHWDFAYGPKRLQQLVSRLNFPMLAINVFDKKSDTLFLPPYLVKEVNGIRVGIIGIAYNIVDKTMPASFSEGIYFTLGREELPPIIETLREEEKVELIILLSHLGLPQTMKLLSEVEGVDICLNAHTHDRITKPIIQGNTIVIESGCHGAFIGELALEIKAGKIIHYTHQLIEVSQTIMPDQDMQVLIDQSMAPYKDHLSKVVGTTATPLDRSTCLESTMDNFLLKAILESSGAEIAFSNGWRYGAPIRAGIITRNDLYDITPMNPVISLVELSGEEMLAMLENNLENTFSADAYKQAGGFVKRAMGIKVFFKMENPKGCRIQALFINDRAIEPDRYYKVAFITVQGVPKELGRNRRDTTIGAVEAMEQFLSKHAPVQITLETTFISV
ncbi:bifunctional metallophosphatase/5'-nucleotidase [Rhodocytophaga aerolata]|uniref:Bifunctional metallophosphatase/5'-nucleotidase n=1 Tax=Rhodocytophaga aerolata TaxID=455078 RepID=A0ABT8RDG5_9BACT|nr:bifunctional metallophosphatase/5'-nucleotidase [Rhodocytophaga aerolata]MDO1449273.1 bifunctional metallophosphatase/5'-nucleotidase [Rhodocytophaga aerolata]